MSENNEKHDIPMQPSFSKAELVRFFNKTERTVQRWVNAGRLVKIRKDTYIIQDEGLRSELQGVLAYEQSYDPSRSQSSQGLSGQVGNDSMDADRQQTTERDDIGDAPFSRSDASDKRVRSDHPDSLQSSAASNPKDGFRSSGSYQHSSQGRGEASSSPHSSAEEIGAMVSFNSTMMQQYRNQLDENKGLISRNSVLEERVNQLSERIQDKDSIIDQQKSGLATRSKWAMFGGVCALIFLIATLISMIQANSLEDVIDTKDKVYTDAKSQSDGEVQRLITQLQSKEKQLSSSRESHQLELQSERAGFTKERENLTSQISDLQSQLTDALKTQTLKEAQLEQDQEPAGGEGGSANAPIRNPDPEIPNEPPTRSRSQAY